ncbi:MAG: IclR family transcriptional regulator [Planctomycetota bacterium]|jgi:DNA-binding IclR family transcriptional regulator
MAKDNSSSLIAMRRGMQVIQELSNSPEGLSFSNLKIVMDLPSATLSRLIKALESEDLVVQTNRGANYQLGERFLTIARSALDSQSLEDNINVVLKNSSAQVHESLAYYEPDGEGKGVALCCKFERPESVYFGELGSRLPFIIENGRISINPFAFISLIYIDDETREYILESAAPKQEDVFEYYEKRKNGVLENGYSIFGNPGSQSLIRVGAPVYAGKDGSFAGVVGTIVDSNNYIELGQNFIVGEVCKAAEKITELLK